MNKIDDDSTKQRILLSTVKLLFSGKPSSPTIRDIAKESKVNVAAINYHFHNKEKLFEQAVETATAQAFEKGLSILHAHGKKPLERLEEYLLGYSFGLMQFPAMTRTAFMNLFQTDSSSNPYGRYTKQMIEEIGGVIAEEQGRGLNKEDESKALLLLSCVIFPFLISNTFQRAGVIDYGNQSQREEYIKKAMRFICLNDNQGGGQS